MTLPVQSVPPAALRPGDVAAALDWWREAGVACDFLEEPRDWLAASAPAATAAPLAAPPPPAPVAPRIGAADAPLPGTLEEFAAWWLREPSLDNGMVDRRIAPRGPAGAPLMVLVADPESDDTERLLSGPQGRMLDAVLGALGIAADQAYVAACLPRHMPLPDWAGLTEAGLGEVVRRHVALARPQRLLVLGNNISSLLGHDPAKTGEPFRDFNHEGTICPVLVASGLDALLARPKAKAALWRALLDWTG